MAIGKASSSAQRREIRAGSRSGPVPEVSSRLRKIFLAQRVRILRNPSALSTAGTGSGNALAGLGSAPNDGLLTIETQKKVPEGFVNTKQITVDLSHNEVLLSMEIVNIIKERVFHENEN